MANFELYDEGFKAGMHDAEYGIGVGEPCYKNKPQEWHNGYEAAQAEWEARNNK